MRNAYLRQIVQAAIVLLNVSLVVFVLVRIVPGDPARLMLGMEASEEAVQAARAQFGFDRPLYVQYVQFVGGALRGDLGQSVRFRRPVGDLLRESFPATLELTTLGFKAPGDQVNLEVDVVAKYVERLLAHHREDG